MVCFRSRRTAAVLCAAILILPRLAPASPQPKIFGADDRQRVQDASVFPYAATGYIEAYYDNETRTGTGALIGKKTVLTAAHVIYDSDLGWADPIVFVPAKNGFDEPYGRITVEHSYVRSEWASRGDNDYDIGLLALSEDIGTQTGFFQLQVLSETDLQNRVLKTAGYPADLGTIYLYTNSGTSSGLDGNLILFNLDSEPGQSGAPVWSGSGSSTRLVGIMKGTLETTMSDGSVEVWNIATHINQTFANWIDDNLAKISDTSQNIANPVTFGAADCGACGSGLPQALPVAFLAWSLYFLPKSRS